MPRDASGVYRGVSQAPWDPRSVRKGNQHQRWRFHGGRAAGRAALPHQPSGASRLQIVSSEYVQRWVKPRAVGSTPHAKRCAPVLSGYNAHSFSRGRKRGVCASLYRLFLVEVSVTVFLRSRCRLKGSAGGAVVCQIPQGLAFPPVTARSLMPRPPIVGTKESCHTLPNAQVV